MSDLSERAAAVLARNDAGGWTKAAPELYPHQWSWDAAFVAIGWAHLDPARAVAELEHLFSAQWANGKLPHIVFDPVAPPAGYFPDPSWWRATLSPDAPAPPPETSGLCQPPVHAVALQRIWRVCAGSPDVAARLRRLWPRLLAWHRYLAEDRDPERSGLVTIYHPWESGADNSPRWDDALARVEVGPLPPYRRRDTEHVADPGQRPTDADYDRYLWLVELLKRARYDDPSIQREHPFLVKDVFFSAILAAANAALLELADVVGAPDADRARIAGWLDAERRGLAGQWDPELSLCLDQDLRGATPVRRRTFAGFAPLVAGDAEPALLAEFRSVVSDHRLRWPLVPSTSPDDPAFESRKYWRGPVWPVVDWLFWRALGDDALRTASLEQIRTCGFAEYVEPFTGEPLGSPDQAWTAAVTLDWLA